MACVKICPKHKKCWWICKIWSQRKTLVNNLCKICPGVHFRKLKCHFRHLNCRFGHLKCQCRWLNANIANTNATLMHFKCKNYFMKLKIGKSWCLAFECWRLALNAGVQHSWNWPLVKWLICVQAMSKLCPKYHAFIYFIFFFASSLHFLNKNILLRYPLSECSSNFQPCESNKVPKKV